MSAKTDLKIISLNINGLNSKIDSLTNLINTKSPDIVCLQETKSNHMNNFKCKNYQKVHLSAMDPETDQTHQSKGGLGFLVKNTLNFEQITPHDKPDNLSLDTFSRLLSIKLLDHDLTVSNIYLPAHDSRIDQDDNSDKLLKVLAYHESATENLNNQIVAGDFNSSPHDTNWRKQVIYEHFEHFSFTDLDFVDKNSYTYTSYAHKTTRHLDRIISTIPANYKKFEILYTGCVGSDHLPILATFELDKNSTCHEISPNKSSPRINWNKVTTKHISAYKQILTSKIKKITKNKLDSEFDLQMLEQLNKALEDSANDSMPKYNSKHHDLKKPRIMNWKEEVEPTKAYYDYFSVKLSMTDKNNQREYNCISQQKALAHSRYRYALRKQRALAKNKLVETTTNSNCFELINKDNFKQTSPPLELEGKKPGNEQLEFWDGHFKETFKGHASPKQLPEDIENAAPVKFNLSELQAAIKEIDTSKSYNHHYHWKYSPICAQKVLLKCYNFWANQPSAQQNWPFLQTSIGPLLKNKSKPQSLKKSYRPIASATSEVWLLEKMTVARVASYLQTEPEQFGYKKSHSTIHCIAIANELKLLQDAHVALLDASSAFDCISHERILDQLRKRKIPKSLIRLILSLTFCTHFTIRWFGQSTSSPFYPYRGVKQGGCLSSFLFAICYDDLIHEIKQTKSGVFINKTFVQILIYADDIFLTAASLVGLQTLYYITIKFTERYSDIQMNPTKSVILRMGTLKRPAESFEKIPTAENHIYLGANIGNKNEFLETCRARKAIYIRTNLLIKQNSAAIACNDTIKKMYLNAYGGVYGIEFFKSIHSSISRAHRYLTTTLWPSANKLRTSEGTLHNSDLYIQAASGANSVYVNHRILRNNFILKSKKSSNYLIREICGNLQVIDTSMIKRTLPVNRVYNGRTIWSSAAFVNKIALDLFS